jgi:PAS domain S-box-containing protein
MKFSMHAVKSITNNARCSRWVVTRQQQQRRMMSTETTTKTYRPLATALSDVMAPSEYEQQQSSKPRVVFHQQHSNYATALSDVMAPSEFEQQEASKNKNEWSGKLSFASPESDFTGQEMPMMGSLPVNDIEYESTSMSFATALSDVMAPTQFEQEHSHIGNKNKQEWSRDISFATPESDFTACNQHEYLVRSLPLDEDEFRSSMAYSLSYATPESDFTSLKLTDQMRAQLHHVEETSKQRQQQPPLQRTSLLPQSYQDYLHQQQNSVDYPEALVVTESKFPFRIVSVNTPWERLCGYTEQECVGETLNILQGPDTDKAKVTALLGKLVGRDNAGDENDDLTMELVNYDKNRRRFTNRLTMGTLRDPQTQQATHFVGMLQDVSHRYPMGNEEFIYL